MADGRKQFVARKTEKRLSTSSIPSVPPPVTKAAASATALVPNVYIFDSILADMSSSPEPTIMGVERKGLAPEKIQKANSMGIKGYTVGKK